jgi:hypothetical protein
MATMKFLLAALLAAAVSFGWSLLSREGMTWRQAGVFGFNDEKGLAEMIRKNAGNGRGVYMLPYSRRALSYAGNEQAQIDADFAKALEQGPFVRAIVRPGRHEPDRGLALLLEFGRSLLGALLLAGLMAPAVLNYPGRLALAAGAGVFAGLLGALPEMIHFELPPREVLVAVADSFIEWLLAGAVLGLFVGREPTARDVR